MKRLLDVSVSILVVIALFMSQSWAVTAAYADYSIDGSDDSNSFHLEGSTSNQAEPISGGQESDAGSVDSEPQDAQQVLSGETNEAAAADSASNDQLTVKNVSVSAHVQNIGWMDPVSSGKVAGTTGRGLNLEAQKSHLKWMEPPLKNRLQMPYPSRPTSPTSAGRPPSATAAPPARPASPAPSRP